MSDIKFNVMTKEEMKAFAIKNIDNEIKGEYTLNDISLDEESSNSNAQEYIGEVFYKEDGERLSSRFAIIIYKNGTYEFEWH